MFLLLLSEAVQWLSSSAFPEEEEGEEERGSFNVSMQLGLAGEIERKAGELREREGERENGDEKIQLQREDDVQTKRS